MKKEQAAFVRKFIRDFLISLGEKSSGKLIKELNAAPEKDMPQMFRETVEGIENIIGPGMFKELKVRLPDGKEVNYDEAKAYCRKKAESPTSKPGQEGPSKQRKRRQK